MSEFQRGFQAGKAYYMKKAEEIIANDISQIYAVGFIVLKRRGLDLDWGELADDIQTMWNDIAEKGIDILDLCEKETGYEIRQGCIMEDIV